MYIWYWFFLSHLKAFKKVTTIHHDNSDDGNTDSESNQNEMFIIRIIKYYIESNETIDGRVSLLW